MASIDRHQKQELAALAVEAMLERGLAPEFTPDVLRQVAELDAAEDPAAGEHADTRDLTGLLWCSIDNDDSRDLDQLTVAEALPGGEVRMLVAIADVDSLVPRSSLIDLQAQINTTSDYTSARIFPMLPERL
ncbi:MAG: RNB domain-containing ribonuclease, partial [Lautropia sp.]